MASITQWASAMLLLGTWVVVSCVLLLLAPPWPAPLSPATAAVTPPPRTPAYGRYVLNLPAFGPNNQYLALRETMVVARILKRTLVANSFTTHKFLGPHSKRAYNSSFDFAALPAGTAGMDTFRAVCDGRHVLVYVRPSEGHWEENAATYWALHGMRPPRLTYAMHAKATRTLGLSGEPQFETDDDVQRYFAPYAAEPCLVVGFLFRTLSSDTLWNEAISYARYMPHAPAIVALAQQVRVELALPPCQIERPALHDGYDFCAGTSIYTWARFDDLVAVLCTALAQRLINTIYIATDTRRTYQLYNLTQRLGALGGAVAKTAADSPTLSVHLRDDEYTRSLVEQELARQSVLVLGSRFSTWTETLEHDALAAGRPAGSAVLFIETLLAAAGHPHLRHDLWQHIAGHEQPLDVEAAALLRVLLPPTAAGGCPVAVTSIVDEAGTPWSLCMSALSGDSRTQPCLVVSASERRRTWVFEQRLRAALPGHCRLVAMQVAPRWPPHPPPGVEGLALHLGDGNYADTRTLSVAVPGVTALLMDIEQREWDVLAALADSEAAQRPRLLVVEVHMWPLWQMYKVPNLDEHAAKARMYREQLERVVSATALRHYHTEMIKNETYSRMILHYMLT